VAIFKQFKTRLGAYYLRKHADKIQRRKSIISYDKLNSIMLMYEITESAIPEAIVQFVELLRKEKKQVQQVVYYSGEIKHLTLDIEDHRMIFTKRDLDLFLIPQKHVIDKFTSFKVDYLIDLSLEDSLPLVYLAAISTPNLRVGRQGQLKGNYYDLLLNIKESNHQLFIQHLLHYLKILPRNNS